MNLFKPSDFQRDKRLREIRQAVADCLQSEGCGCCSDREKHDADKAALGKLLRVPMYPDKSGYNFAQFRTKK
jgi:methionine aminopeptidase